MSSDLFCRDRVRKFCRPLLILTLTVLSTAQADDSPVTPGQKLTLVSEDFGLADGPAWDGRDTLYVPDVKRSLIRSYVPTTARWATIYDSDDRFSASFFRGGKLYLSNNSAAKIQAIDTDKIKEGPQLVLPTDDAPKPMKRPNDLVVDQHGGLYFTLTGHDQVMYVSPDGTAKVATTEVKSPNGITMSPDGSVLYVSAYFLKKVFAFPLTAPGKPGAGKVLAAMDDGEAPGADGMCIDSAGNVYCAGATDVWIWNSEGKLLDRIPCPTRPINCCFGDADRKTLYITGFGGLYKQPMQVAGPAVMSAPATDDR